MSLGLPNDGPNPYMQYTFFSSLWVWSSHTPRDTNTVICVALTTKMTDGDNDRLSPRAWSARWETTTSSTAYWTISSLKSQRPSTKRSKRVFQKGDLVLPVRQPIVMTHKTKAKFQPKWEWPFVVETVYSNRAYHLANSDSDTLMMPINGKFLISIIMLTLNL